MGNIIDLAKEMADEIQYEMWNDAGETLASIINIAMGAVDSDASLELSCWMGASGRGVGNMRTKCGEGEERKARLCYPLCEEGYKGVANLCWQRCPEEEGWRNDGMFCKKPRWKDECPDDMRNIGMSCRKDRYSRGSGHSPDC